MAGYPDHSEEQLQREARDMWLLMDGIEKEVGPAYCCNGVDNCEWAEVFCAGGRHASRRGQDDVWRAANVDGDCNKTHMYAGVGGFPRRLPRRYG